MEVSLPEQNFKTMKKIISVSSILVVFIFSSLLLNAANGTGNPPKANAVISGQVQDFNTGESLAGVVVTLEGSDVKTYTDLDGNFEIKGMTPGKYNLVFSFISYNKSLVEDIDIAESETEILEVKLLESK